jgi:hypothetical protein
MKITKTGSLIEMKHANLLYIAVGGAIPVFLLTIAIIAKVAGPYSQIVNLFGLIGFCGLIAILIMYRSYQLSLNIIGASSLITRNILGVKKTNEFTANEIAEIHYSFDTYGRGGSLYGIGTLEFHLQGGSWITVCKAVSLGYARKTVISSLLPHLEALLGQAVIHHQGNRKFNEFGSKKLF